MSKWKKMLDGPNKEDNQSFAKPLDLNKSPSERMLKSSRGTIDECDAWGVYTGEDYLDRNLKVINATEEDLWKKYIISSWTRACVDKIIKEAVKYRVVIKAKDPTKANNAQVKKHIEEVSNLLVNPNDNIESFDDIRRKFLRDILVYDAGAVEIVYENNVPTELYDLKGSRIRLNLDKHGNFVGTDNEDGGHAYVLLDSSCQQEAATFGKYEVIYMINNPVSGSAYGLSPIETLWDDITNEIEAARFNQRILKHSGMMSGVLSFAGMSAKKLVKNQKYWQEELRRKGQKLVITNNPNVNFVKVSESQKDMQFFEYQKWLLNKIMAVYGMQPIVLGVVDGTTGKLNSAEQREQFKQDAILPLLKLEAHRFTDVLIKNGFDYDDVEFSHIEPINVNEEMDLKKLIEGGKLGVITINEAREFINLPPLEGEAGKQLVSATAMNQIKAIVEKEEKKDEIATVRAKIQELLNSDIVEE